MPQNIEISIDYLAFTLKSISIQLLLQKIKKSQLIELSSGKRGYKKGFFIEHTLILYDGREDMGIHIDASSQGLPKAYEILQIAKKEKAEISYTRIDIALDIRDKDIWSQAYMATKVKNYKTRWKTWRLVQSFETNTNKPTGRTLYYGSRKSAVMLRVYDKALEQGEEGDRTRLELEIKGENANNTVEILEHYPLGSTFFGILNQYISFIDRTASKNISRCPNLDRWSDIIQDAPKISVTPAKKEQDLDKSYQWLLKQVSRTYAKITLLDKKTGLKLAKGIEEVGKRKLSTKDEEDIDKYILKKIEEEEKNDEFM